MVGLLHNKENHLSCAPVREMFNTSWAAWAVVYLYTRTLHSQQTLCCKLFDNRGKRLHTGADDKIPAWKSAATWARRPHGWVSLNRTADQRSFPGVLTAFLKMLCITFAIWGKVLCRGGVERAHTRPPGLWVAHPPPLRSWAVLPWDCRAL